MTEQDINKLASKIIADVTGIAENSISSINFNSLDVSVKEGMSTTLDAIKNFLSITTDDNFKGLLLTTVGDRFELKLLPIKFLKLRRLLENNVLKLYDNNVGIVVFDKVENCYVKAADIMRKSGNPLNVATTALTGSTVNSIANSDKTQTKDGNGLIGVIAAGLTGSGYAFTNSSDKSQTERGNSLANAVVTGLTSSTANLVDSSNKSQNKGRNGLASIVAVGLTGSSHVFASESDKSQTKEGNDLASAAITALTGSAVNSIDNSNKEQTSAKKERDYDKEFKDDLSETFRVANLITAGLNKLGKLMKSAYSNITFTKVADSTILLSHMQQNMMTKGSATQPIAYIGDYELSLVVNAGLWYTKVCGIFNDFCFLCVRDTRVKDDSYLTAEDLNLDPNDIDLCTLAKRLLSISTSAASVTNKDKNQIIDVLKSQADALRATLDCNKANTIELSAQEKETLEKALEITENYLSKIRSNSSDDDKTGRMKIFK